jgi:hypothetical protein
MEHQRFDQSHQLTPQPYRCPACRATSQMEIEWPIWRCPLCGERLIPADLQRASASTSPSPAADPAGATTQVADSPAKGSDAPSAP